MSMESCLGMLDTFLGITVEIFLSQPKNLFKVARTHMGSFVWVVSVITVGGFDYLVLGL